MWARDGRELFYLDLTGRLTTVPVQASATGFTFGNPARLLNAAYANTLTSVSRAYDVSADGRRFLMIKESVPDTARTGMVVVLNWFEELKAKLSSQ